MVVFNSLLVLTAGSGLVAGVLWLRVAASQSLEMASRLDGTEKMAARGNRRAFKAAVIASALTLLLAVGAYWAGAEAGVL